MLPRAGAGGGRDGGRDGLVPDLSLRVEAQKDLFAMRYCDSVTVDLYEAGYIPYLAGALVYRDKWLKNLVTWMSLYLLHGSVTSIGIHGVKEFEPALYGNYAVTFKKRLRLDDHGQSLRVLRNAGMSPFASLPAKGAFINMLDDTFRQVIEEEVKVCQAYNDAAPDYHSFLIHGTDKIFLSHQSMFHIAKHRRQIILGVEFDEASTKAYGELEGNTKEEITLKTSDKINLASLPERVASEESPLPLVKTLPKNLPKDLLKNRALTSATADPPYPARLTPFYLYGSPREPHILTRAPNIGLSAGAVSLVRCMALLLLKYACPS
ncbi:hypothetical protein B0T25DRAFT_513661 [Lasiosphaeria hispida]|uniref:Uncharacterized protein n=1 Tax=Lasiosphaeria hispida TaxID=260671 RepID=A0AAJ0HVK1_9PEZI|nr:hypothetical protein B0T25DRAFT_513661 [Lasiosphaeria hispida]